MEIRDLTIAELSQGYQLIEDEYTCLFYGQKFHQDEVFPVENLFFLREE